MEQRASIIAAPFTTTLLDLKNGHTDPDVDFDLCVSLNTPDLGDASIGVCVKGTDTGKHVYFTQRGESFLCACPELISSLKKMEFCALEGNELKLTAGKTYFLTLSEGKADSAPLLGFAMSNEHILFALDIETSSEAKEKGASSSECKRQRTNLKPIVITGSDGKEQTLKKENAMRVVVAWLEKHNADLVGLLLV